MVSILREQLTKAQETGRRVGQLDGAPMNGRTQQWAQNRAGAICREQGYGVDEFDQLVSAWMKGYQESEG